MRRNVHSPIEMLESRQFLSASAVAVVPVGSTPPRTPPITVPTPTSAPVVTGPTLNATAGTAFTGTVGFYASPVLDPPLAYSATINWGDGVTSKAVLTYGSNGTATAFGYVITGTHTYAKAGNYTVRTTLVSGPLNNKSKLPTRIIETIVDKAIVAPPSTTPGGVTIHATAGVSFTGVIGTFGFPAPGKGLVAVVSWGDGASSGAAIVPIGPSGIDVINYNVIGTHTYAAPGTYDVTIQIERIKAAASTAPVVVLTINSTADVTAGTTPLT